MIEEAELHEHQFLGVLRGGAIPTAILGYRFKQRPVFIDVQSYDKRKQHFVLVDNEMLLKLDTLKSILIIDDLIDTGHTLLALYKTIQYHTSINQIGSALVYSKDMENTCVFAPTIVARALGEKWVKFPYDV